MSSKTKSIIFYTDNQITESILSLSTNSIKDSGLLIFSCSLEPMSFGFNRVIHLQRCYPTMVKQIISCLERSTTDYVFFCEHDVIYNNSHFDFQPTRDDIFYYNSNVWRWDYPKNRYITYDRLISLSGLCVNRKLALDHFRARLEFIESKGYGFEKGEPSWARKMGYEPGTKKKRKGGFSNDDFDTWKSEEPLIDIRHKGTFSPSKVSLKNFKHKPTGWRETTTL